MSQEIREAKRRLRRELLARRRGVSPAEADAAGRACAQHLLAEPAVASARRVALYAALPGEVPTRPLFEALAARGTPCLLPRTGADRRLAFAPAADWSTLFAGRFGALEPPASAAPVELGVGDAVVLPGVAFDREGWRLGRGQGCYDRSFSGAAEPLLVGLAYAFQLVAAVPHDSHDRPVDAIVTEEGFLWIGRGKDGRST